MGQMHFSKDDIERTMQELCDDYNATSPVDTLNNKIYRALILIAICELTRLYQSQCDEAASQDRA